MSLQAAEWEVYIMLKFRHLYMPCLLLILLFSGCNMMKIGKDMQQMDRLVTIRGTIRVSPPSGLPVAVVLLNVDRPSRPVLINIREMARPGEFTFRADPGHYRIFAYESKGGDRKYQPGSRVSRSGPISLLKPGSQTEVELMIQDRADTTLAARIEQIRSGMKIDIANASLHSGSVTTLDNPAFKPENVTMGLWQPFRFAKEIPFGVFFLQKYDPAKVPVLLVHGISGSPANFKDIIDNLDKKHFQPWVFYYPSGFRLNLIATYLDTVMDGLYCRHNFKHVALIAHSMGGLVSRAFLNRRAGREADYTIDCFVTMSTPWAGHAAANLGVKYAPAVVPVWNDVAKDSDFIKELFSIPLPRNMHYYLVFSFKGDSMFADGNNDGVVSIASELRHEAQEEALMIRGADDTHMGILKDDYILSFINGILALDAGPVEQHGENVHLPAACREWTRNAAGFSAEH